jgi:archaemetzincin
MKYRPANHRAEVKTLARPPKVLVVVLGAVPRELVVAAGAEVGRVFGVAVSALAPQGRPEFARNEGRGQYHSAAILRRLAHARSGGAPIVGLTDVDLFVPDASFVFGDADRDAQAAIVSTARLAHGADGKDVDPERLRRRVLAETVHELGHLLGLSHCADQRCAMFLSHRPSDADRKGPGFCASCRAALGLPG